MLDKERLKNGTFFNKGYFENLLAEIREIRASERRFYQKITDIYATAMDYSADAETRRRSFATVQNKLHFAIHGHTAAELIVGAGGQQEGNGVDDLEERAARGKFSSRMSPSRRIPHRKELKSLDRFRDDVSRLRRGSGRAEIPDDHGGLGRKLNAFLKFNERDILDHPGRSAGK